MSTTVELITCWFASIGNFVTFPTTSSTLLNEPARIASCPRLFTSSMSRVIVVRCLIADFATTTDTLAPPDELLPPPPRDDSPA